VYKTYTYTSHKHEASTGVVNNALDKQPSAHKPIHTFLTIFDITKLGSVSIFQSSLLLLGSFQFMMAAKIHLGQISQGLHLVNCC